MEIYLAPLPLMRIGAGKDAYAGAVAGPQAMRMRALGRGRWIWESYNGLPLL